MALHKLQKFEIDRVHRSQLKNAPYNPRGISPENLKKLKRNLKKHGLLMPLVWNATTGNLVSGHQRLFLLDETEDSGDYSLDVSVVRLSEKDEVSQNMFMNNQDAMGFFDVEKLEATLRKFEVDIEDTGFDMDTLAVIGIDENVFKRELNKIEENVKKNAEEIAKAGKELKDEVREKNADKALDHEIFLIVLFQTLGDKEEFLKKCGLAAGTRYVSQETINVLMAGAFKKKLDAAASDDVENDQVNIPQT